MIVGNENSWINVLDGPFPKIYFDGIEITNTTLAHGNVIRSEMVLSFEAGATMDYTINIGGYGAQPLGVIFRLNVENPDSIVADYWSRALELRDEMLASPGFISSITSEEYAQLIEEDAWIDIFTETLLNLGLLNDEEDMDRYGQMQPTESKTMVNNLKKMSSINDCKIEANQDYAVCRAEILIKFPEFVTACFVKNYKDVKGFGDCTNLPSNLERAGAKFLKCIEDIKARYKECIKRECYLAVGLNPDRWRENCELPPIGNMGWPDECFEFMAEELDFNCLRPQNAMDPNEKVGPTAENENNLIAINLDHPYIVYFENMPEATAAAIDVTVTDQLDPDLEWRKFRLGEIAFGDTTIIVPENRSYWHTTVDLDSLGLLLEIDAGINAYTGEAHWYFNTIDPLTGQAPVDPFAGFLPPNDSTGRGEGHVSYTIMAKNDLPEGTEITNSATIVFDINDPIITNEVVNVIYYPKPDFYISSLTFQADSLLEGELVLLNATIENQGEGEGNANSFNIQLYEGHPDTGGTPVGNPEQVDCIDPGMLREVDIYWTPSQSGDLDIYLIADYDDQIEEESETNNARSLRVTVIRACDCGIWGDVTGDGGVNPLDVTYMVQYVYYTNDMRVQPPKCPLEAGDVANCDLAVSPLEVVYYVQYVYFQNNMFCPDPCGP